MNPPVTCCCKTFGRVATLNETLFSFLNQKYDGRKQLVIYNDFDLQTLEFDHPEVKIINAKTRCTSLGDARNKTIEAADCDIVIAFDDDDIYLPNHLSLMVSLLKNGSFGFASFLGYFYSEGREIKGFQNGMGNFLIHTKEAWEKVGKYDPDINAGEDQLFGKKLRDNIHGTTAHFSPEESQFIYCFGNGVYHISGEGFDVKGKLSGWERTDRFVRGQAAAGRIPTGVIQLKPEWKSDWSAMKDKFVEGMK